MMQQKSNQLKPIEIPITKGSLPLWQPRLGYPNLLNMFNGEDGNCYSTPGKLKLSPNAPDDGSRAIYFSSFGGGSYFVVTESDLVQIFPNGSYKVISPITNTGFAVQFSENIQKQITFVDGRKARVYDQSTQILTVLGVSNGFELEQPISTVCINGITIVLDRKTNGFVISDVNNALVYPPLDNVPKIGPQLTQGVSLEVLKNNLYIFGTTAIERWVPNTGNSPYLFPFTKDMNYEISYGAISTNGVIAGPDEIYFLSSKFTPMVLTVKGYEELIKPVEGLAKIISQYQDIEKVTASYTTFRGNYFVYFSFPITNISWVYNVKTKTFAQGDDILTGAVTDEFISTTNGVYSWSLSVDHAHRSITSELIRLYKGTQPNRQLLNGVECQIIQGLIQEKRNQLELTVSLDGLSWTNTVSRLIGKTGERNAVTTWNMKIAAQQAMYRIDYYGDLDLTISKLTAYIK